MIANPPDQVSLDIWNTVTNLAVAKPQQESPIPFVVYHCLGRPRGNVAVEVVLMEELCHLNWIQSLDLVYHTLANNPSNGPNDRINLRTLSTVHLVQKYVTSQIPLWDPLAQKCPSKRLVLQYKVNGNRTRISDQD